MQHTGHSSPLGAVIVDGGVIFSLFSRSATGVELLLFDREDDARPAGDNAATAMKSVVVDVHTYDWEVTRRYTCHPRAPLCMILNAYWEPLDFELPPVDQVGGKLWRRWIDTALDAPYDIVPWQTAPALSGRTDRAAACSVVMLYTGLGD